MSRPSSAAEARMQARLEQLTKNVVPKTPFDKKLIAAGHLKPSERLDVSTGEISSAVATEACVE
jgi:hypothetical protein